MDVVVEHEVYGQITADLFLKNRGDVDDFMEKLLKKQFQSPEYSDKRRALPHNRS